jgi:aspartyl-tRNA(Asn)/glutamyl-tRNA(Gln) amidotransferase subunit A
MPIGMQVVGQAFAEPMVFKVADAYQQLTDWHLRAPVLMEAQLA